MRPEQLDLRGVKCPLNWAKARVRLESLPAGTILELVIDDPKGARDIPRAAEACGHLVVEVMADAHAWRLLIQK